MRLLKWLLGLLLLVVLAVTGALAYLATTEDGLQRLLVLGQRFAPGELSWRQAEGRIAGPLSLAGLRYRQADGLDVAIETLELAWRPGELPGRLHLERLRLSGLTLRLPPPAAAAPAPQRPVTLPSVELPLAIAVDELDLRAIQVYPWGADEPIVIDRVRLRAAGEERQLRLLELAVASPQGEASLRGTIEPVADYPLDLSLDWRIDHPRFGAFSGGGTASGDLRRLAVRQRVRGAVEAELSGTVTGLPGQPGWDLLLTAVSDDLGVFSPAVAGAPLDVRLQSRGDLEDYSVGGQVETTLPQTGPVTLDLAASGDLARLGLERLRLRPRQGPGELSLQGEVALSPLRLDLRGRWQALGWPLQGEAPSVGLPTGHLTLAGSPDDLRAVVDTALEGPQLGRLRLRADAALRGEAVTLSSLTLQGDDSDLMLEAGGNVDLASRRLDLAGQWSALGWPLTGEAQYLSPQGRFAVTGSLDDYRIELTADTAGKAMPAGAWRLTGRGSTQALSRFELVGRLLDGEWKVAGSAAWQPRPVWDVTLDASGIDPGRQWPQLPGRVSLALQTQGRLTDSGPEVTATIRSLGGRLRGQPLSGGGKLSLRGKTLAIDDLELASGRTRLRADGRMAEARWALQWSLDAPDLAALSSRLDGRVSASGRLGGDAARPLLALDLDVRNLAAGQARVGRLAGSALIDVGGGQRSRIDLAGEKLQLGGQSWSRLTLRGGGRPERHRLNLALEGAPVKLALALDGAWSESRWRGRITRLDALDSEVGDWRLVEPAPLTAAADTARLVGLCLASAPAKLCLDGDWQAGRGGRGALRLDGLDARRFARFLPPETMLETALDGDVDLRLGADGKPRVEAALRLRPGTLTLPGDLEPVVVRLGASRVDARLAGENGSADLQFDLGELGRVAGRVGLAALGGDRPRLDGRLEADLRDLAIVSAFVPQLQAVEGHLTADLKLKGQPTRPLVLGRLALTGFAAEVPAASLKIRDGRLVLASDGEGPLRIDGEAKSGDGWLKLAGTVDPATRALDLEIRGERFEVAATRQLRAVVSPGMHIVMGSDGMRVEGELLIPSAHVRAGGGGDGKLVRSSGDVVIVDEAGVAEEKTPAGNFHLDLRVVLGDDVRVQVADFAGKLKGNLRLTQKPGLAPRATGVIEVVDGDYIVYGQQLNIQRGRILFSGGPVDNPRLDMDVARRVEAYDVLAGARIRGTAQAPILQLYSEPAMPDSSILSYMLLGQPPGTKGASFTLGKYLTPDLYVGYGIGLFNAINTFNMRYRLTDKLALHAASGLANSADLIYSIER